MITFARLQHVRSYDDGSFEFDPGVNIIVGPNASGKTTLIEALVVGLKGKSFKARDAELLQEGADWARIDIGGDTIDRVCKLQYIGETLQKTLVIDDKEYKRLSLQKTIPTVLFEPNNLLLLHGSPELRRAFLDDLLGSLRPGYDGTLRHYKRVLAQRNALLKAPRSPSPEQLFVWNLRLSELGGKLVEDRSALLKQFNERIGHLYSAIAGTETAVELVYRTKLPLSQYETGLLHALEQTINQDITRGFTSYGPHREDMHVIIDGKAAQESASRGEVRTLVLALKMLEAEFVESARAQKPVLLLDDVFSELDGKRRHALVRFLDPYQAFITTTDADVAIEHFNQSTNIIALG